MTSQIWVFEIGMGSELVFIDGFAAVFSTEELKSIRFFVSHQFNRINKTYLGSYGNIAGPKF